MLATVLVMKQNSFTYLIRKYWSCGDDTQGKRMPPQGISNETSRLAQYFKEESITAEPKVTARVVFQ